MRTSGLRVDPPGRGSRGPETETDIWTREDTNLEKSDDICVTFQEQKRASALWRR